MLMILGIATYLQTSSLGRTARILSLSFIQSLKNPLFGTGKFEEKSTQKISCKTKTEDKDILLLN